MENTVQEAKTLPARVAHVKVGEKDVYLVGTAHISKESVEDVRATVEQVRPESICIELCKARHQAMTQADNWRKMDIFKIIRQKKAVFLLAQLILSSFYRRLGEKLGVQPGAEMLEGIRLAEQTGATLVLADRDIDVTLKRVWGYLGFWTKLKLAMQLLMSILFSENIDAGHGRAAQEAGPARSDHGRVRPAFPGDQAAPDRRAGHLSGPEDPHRPRQERSSPSSAQATSKASRARSTRTRVSTS